MAGGNPLIENQAEEERETRSKRPDLGEAKALRRGGTSCSLPALCPPNLSSLLDERIRGRFFHGSARILGPDRRGEEPKSRFSRTGTNRIMGMARPMINHVVSNIGRAAESQYKDGYQSKSYTAVFISFPSHSGTRYTPSWKLLTKMIKFISDG
ncbi:hypothetical protein CRG98_007241 [Punica granatum]|uniref:Uncharacterized protein n=1 Tax=Punica granatum TaxID=22663 RepID=A0A2I0KV74_PUNGR|nr:hypothetical protein CRG98_007241 [Punica granatum]